MKIIFKFGFLDVSLLRSRGTLHTPSGKQISINSWEYMIISVRAHDSLLPLNRCFLFFVFVLSQTHQLDHSAHYLRLKFLVENKMQHYIPKPEEDVYELVMFTTVVQVHAIGDYSSVICVLVLIVVGEVEQVLKQMSLVQGSQVRGAALLTVVCPQSGSATLLMRGAAPCYHKKLKSRADSQTAFSLLFLAFLEALTVFCFKLLTLVRKTALTLVLCDFCWHVEIDGLNPVG